MKKLIFFLLTLLAIHGLDLYAQSAPEQGDYLLIENPDYDPGFFSVFHSILGALEIYDRGNYSGIEVNLKGGRYLDPEKGPNWWEYFFEPIRISNPEVNSGNIYALREQCLPLAFGAIVIPKERLHYLIQKYIHVKKEIKNQVDEFVKTEYADHFVIGVHHRGTDKVVEQDTIPFETTYSYLSQAIEGLSEVDRCNFRVYVATDDNNFLNFMLERFGDKLLYNDFKRSTTLEPLHMGNFYANNYEKGKEALLDCLLLSKCDLLLRPWSNLSCASSYFSPTMPVVIVLNQDSIAAQKVSSLLAFSKECLNTFSNQNYPNPYPQ